MMLFEECRAESVVLLITCQEKKVKIILTASLYDNKHKQILTDRHKQKYVYRQLLWNNISNRFGFCQSCFANEVPMETKAISVPVNRNS